MAFDLSSEAPIEKLDTENSFAIWLMAAPATAMLHLQSITTDHCQAITSCQTKPCQMMSWSPSVFVI